MCPAENVVKITIKMKTIVRKPLMIKIIKLRLRNLDILQSCMNNKVVPDYISRRISKIKCHNSINVERTFIKDEIVFYSAYINSLETRLHTFWQNAWSSLGFFDIFCFSKYLSNTGNNTKDKTLDKIKSFLHFLVKRKFGCVLTSNKHIFNFSSYVLSDCEKLVLSRGQNFAPRLS